LVQSHDCPPLILKSATHESACQFFALARKITTKAKNADATLTSVANILIDRRNVYRD